MDNNIPNSAPVTFTRKQKAVLFVSAFVIGAVATATMQRLTYERARVEAVRDINTQLINTFHKD